MLKRGRPRNAGILPNYKPRRKKFKPTKGTSNDKKRQCDSNDQHLEVLSVSDQVS